MCYKLFFTALQKPQAVVTEEDSNKESAGEITEIVEDSRHSKKGMVLPFEPHYITFNDIKYSVDMPQVGPA